MLRSLCARRRAFLSDSSTTLSRSTYDPNLPTLPLGPPILFSTTKSRLNVYCKSYSTTLSLGSAVEVRRAFVTEVDEKNLPWLSESVPRNFWGEKQNQRRYVNWLGKKLGYSKREDWYQISSRTISANGGRTLIDLYYRGSPFELLRAVYDDFEFKPWLFKSVGPTYWNSIENQRMFLNDLAQNFSASTSTSTPDLSLWYNRSYREIKALGGSAVLARYGGSIYRMVSFVYPEYDFIPWKFKSRPKSILGGAEDLAKMKAAMEKALDITKPSDWYNVSLDLLKEKDLLKLFRPHGLKALLERFYPDIQWNEKLLVGGGHKRSSERMLGVVLRELFPNQELLEEYQLPMDPSSKSVSVKSMKPLRFDFYLPSEKLAFEFQGKQHYEQQNVYGDSIPRMKTDEAKERQCQELGIVLVSVPFWWDKKLSSLIRSILEKRPDLNESPSSFFSNED